MGKKSPPPPPPPGFLASDNGILCEMLVFAWLVNYLSVKKMPAAAKTALFIVGWWGLNIAYNVFNKKLSTYSGDELGDKLPITSATLSLGLGLPYVVPIFLAKLGDRTFKLPPAADLEEFAKIAVFNSIGHIGAVVALGEGAVVYTHVIKAMEPAFSAAMGYILSGGKTKISTAKLGCLVPVIGGVVYGFKEKLGAGGEITPLLIAGAMASNLFFSWRGIVAKGGSTGKTYSKADQYMWMTAMSLIISLPMMLALEGKKLSTVFGDAKPSFSMSKWWTMQAMTAVAFYTYNESGFYALGGMDAITHAVCNTIKRVAIMIASVIIFSKPMSTTEITGAAIAIGGVLLYSIADTVLAPPKATKPAASAPVTRAASKGKKQS